jgi:hypothetical protein
MLESIRLAEDFFKEEPNSYTELAKNDRLFEGIVDRLHRHLNETEWKRVDALRDLLKSHRERILSEEVIKQATVNGGFLKLDLHTHEDGKKIPFNPPFIQVPKNPFLHWCLRFFNWEDHGHETPRWEFVAGSGLKMMNDDPYHTDWVLGAGIPLDQVYDHDDQSLGAVLIFKPPPATNSHLGVSCPWSSQLKNRRHQCKNGFFGTWMNGGLKGIFLPSS